eukprot:scaffold27142_cov18-Tisochrysis_lutea.AAC.2
MHQQKKIADATQRRTARPVWLLLLLAGVMVMVVKAAAHTASAHKYHTGKLVRPVWLLLLARVVVMVVASAPPARKQNMVTSGSCVHRAQFCAL